MRQTIKNDKYGEIRKETELKRERTDLEQETEVVMRKLRGRDQKKQNPNRKVTQKRSKGEKNKKGD